MNLIEHIKRQIEWSAKTFGPGPRTCGILTHINKEIVEIYENPKDLKEWIDIVILALDGAWRSGHSAEEISAALELKQTINEGREWPDWRLYNQDQPIEHVRIKDERLVQDTQD